MRKGFELVNSVSDTQMLVLTDKFEFVKTSVKRIWMVFHVPRFDETVTMRRGGCCRFIHCLGLETMQRGIMGERVSPDAISDLARQTK